MVDDYQYIENLVKISPSLEESYLQSKHLWNKKLDKKIIVTKEDLDNAKTSLAKKQLSVWAMCMEAFESIDPESMEVKDAISMISPDNYEFTD